MITDLLLIASLTLSIYLIFRLNRLEHLLKNNHIIEDIKQISDLDELFDQAVRLVLNYEKATTSLLQRKFCIGYNRAARIIDQLREHDIISLDTVPPYEVNKDMATKYVQEHNIKQS